MFKIFCVFTCLLCSIFSMAQLKQKLDSLLQFPSNEIGFSLLIEDNGKILYQRSGGLADISAHTKVDAATNFRMASVSKQFTAMGILLLEKEHKLSLEDPVGRYLPELPARVSKSVLIRHLLTHTSGVPDYEDLIPAAQTKQVLDADVLQLLKGADFTYFLPGSRFRYSNSGFCLLALIIERVSHQSFSSFIKNSIFVPLKMDHSSEYEDGKPITNRAMGYAKDNAGKVVFSDQSVTSATKGDGGVYTSINDYVKWIHALQQNKFVNLQEVMKRIRFRIKPEANNYYAAGWFETGLQEDVLFHSGSTCGFNNYIIEVPKRKLSVIYFSNLADNVKSFKAIAEVIKQSGLAEFSQVLKLHDLTN